LLEIRSNMMTPEQLRTLHELAEERQRGLALDIEWEKAKLLVDRAKAFLSAVRLPRPLRLALGRCL
jgi:hypothetical protein